jgi:hypothetical protein
MANCDKHFGVYNGNIRLTDARRKSLKGSRKELRTRLENGLKKTSQMKQNQNLVGRVQCLWTQS